jgi:hypothetical protein
VGNHKRLPWFACGSSFAAARESSRIAPVSNPTYEGVKTVRNFLERRLGKEVEIQCEGMMVKGKVDKIEGNVLVLTKDEETCYLNIEKIIAVWDSREKKAQPPGFLSKTK